ncbi:hypothetical protein SNEBB_011379 [Seison nebaliae]|nr:hypothetical protein SNEBB_011379 [Seison nebaliae]
MSFQQSPDKYSHNDDNDGNLLIDTIIEEEEKKMRQRKITPKDDYRLSDEEEVMEKNSIEKNENFNFTPHSTTTDEVFHQLNKQGQPLRHHHQFQLNKILTNNSTSTNNNEIIIDKEEETEKGRLLSDSINQKEERDFLHNLRSDILKEKNDEELTINKHDNEKCGKLIELEEEEEGEQHEVLQEMAIRKKLNERTYIPSKTGIFSQTNKEIGSNELLRKHHHDNNINNDDADDDDDNDLSELITSTNRTKPFGSWMRNKFRTVIGQRKYEAIPLNDIDDNRENIHLSHRNYDKRNGQSNHLLLNVNDNDDDDDDDEIVLMNRLNSSSTIHNNLKMTTTTSTTNEESSNANRSTERLFDDPERETNERWYSSALQVFIPFIIAGLGTVGAGIALDNYQHRRIFTEVSEVFILVPALLGLKGNLEMTLASRLSTQANLGRMSNRSDCISIIYGNMFLTQCQALVIGLLAAIVAIFLGWLRDHQFSFAHSLLLMSSSAVTALFAAIILGSIMCGIIYISYRLKLNPDNIATPIAASLGDLITLTILTLVASTFYNILSPRSKFEMISNSTLSLNNLTDVMKDVDVRHVTSSTTTGLIVCSLSVILSIFFIPLWAYLSYRNKYVQRVLFDGWTPVLSAMVISSLGGLILDTAVSKFHGIAVFQPVINGVGGNLAAVQASRLSTKLHHEATHQSNGETVQPKTNVCVNPFKFFFFKNEESKMARLLLAMVIPGHLIFVYLIAYVKAGHTSITFKFILTYISAALIQVIVLLFLAHCIVYLVWNRGGDPDNVSIPYLTAFGDLIGTSLLSLTFLILFSIGDADYDVGD